MLVSNNLVLPTYEFQLSILSRQQLDKVKDGDQFREDQTDDKQRQWHPEREREKERERERERERGRAG